MVEPRGATTVMVRRNSGLYGYERALRRVGFDPVAGGFREVLCALGNGYWGTRGAAPECDSDAAHYPGTDLAGVYNRVSTSSRAPALRLRLAGICASRPSAKS